MGHDTDGGSLGARAIRRRVSVFEAVENQTVNIDGWQTLKRDES
jgi:hypothetical protein